jgi:preprotein translocase SecE subunit
VQASQLPDEEIEAEHARQGRVLEVLPLVRPAHPAPGDPLTSARQQPQRPAAPTEERKRRTNFVAESWAELKKVEWPKQNQVVQGTFVVIIACVVVGIFLYANDQVWKQVVTKVLLGQ